MKRITDRLRNFAFSTFRPGFAAIWLVAGALPLIAAFALMWHTGVRDAKMEHERQTAILHGLLADVLRQTVDRLNERAEHLAGEPVVRSIAAAGEAGESGDIADDGERLGHLHSLFARTLADPLPVRDICISSANAGFAVCSDQTAVAASVSSAGGVTRLESVAIGSDRRIIRFVKPFAASGTDSASSIVFVLDEQRLLYPGRFPMLEDHALLDAGGHPVAGGNPANAKGTVSTVSVNVLSEKWTSVARWEAESTAGLRRNLLRSAAAAGLLLVLLATGSSILFSFGVSRPLAVLRKLMKRAESGDLKAYWTLRTTGEIGQLGESYNQMLNRIEELIKQVKEEEALKKEKEIEALHYQLNPHFLYNTLNTIKWVAKIHKTPQISEAVSALVRLLQASLGKKGDFIPLGEEILLVRDYMAIQSFRYGDGIVLETVIEPVTSLCLVPKLILQPLVENAILHGLHEKEGERIITIRSWLDRDLLMIQVEDNGIGMDGEPESEKTASRRMDAMERMSGIGLRHIREKLRLYYGPDYPMRIFSKPGEGTKIRLAMPIHRSDS